ncbi:MAG: hypothetical protein ACHP9Z_21075 [Streptosporangiales bacterium]
MSGAQRGRGALGARLVAAACCLLAAGAGFIVLATGMLAHGYLMGQADWQLRAYARMVASGPFTVMPDYPGPGAGAGILTEVTSRGGQLVLRTGPGRPAGPAVARIPRRAGLLATVPASSGGGSWLVIAVPVHYQAQRIAYTYGSGGFSLLVSGTARPGVPGTLITGLDLARVGQAVRRLTITSAAVSAALLVAVAAAALAVIRALYGRAGQASAAAEVTARRSVQRLGGGVADTCRGLQPPLSVIAGFAGSYRRRRPLRAGQADRMMGRIADEAARMDALIDGLPLPRPGPPARPD